MQLFIFSNIIYMFSNVIIIYKLVQDFDMNCSYPDSTIFTYVDQSNESAFSQVHEYMSSNKHEF